MPKSVNLLHILRTFFLKNTSGRLFLYGAARNISGNGKSHRNETLVSKCIVFFNSTTKI